MKNHLVPLLNVFDSRDISYCFRKKKKKLVFKQFDIKTTVLYDGFEEEIYMKQPIRYEDGSIQVCKLQWSLYGLKPSSRCWNEKFKTILNSFDLRETKADSSEFIYKTDIIIYLRW